MEGVALISMPGCISDRLRATFDQEDPAWWYGDEEEIEVGKHRKGQDSLGHGAPKGQISDRLPNSNDEGWSPPRSSEPVKDPHPARVTKPGEEDGWSPTGRK